MGFDAGRDLPQPPVCGLCLGGGLLQLCGEIGGLPCGVMVDLDGLGEKLDLLTEEIVDMIGDMLSEGYAALGVTRDGLREVLGLWIAENEGAKFWLSMMNELKNRGTQDILIAVVDGLKGFHEAITAAFPVQLTPDLAHPIDAPVLLEDALDLGPQDCVAPSAIRHWGRIGPLGQVIVVGGRGDRRLWGGRGTVRRTLYLAALIASRFEPGFRAFKERLLTAGKAKKVVIVACARKLLTVLNAMMRTGTTYRDATA